MNLLYDKDSAVKIFVTFTALLLFLNTFTNVLSMIDYTCTIVCLYLGCFLVRTLALIVLLLNVSPFVLDNYIIKVFPFLHSYLGRALFYVALSSLCFGEEMGWFGKINGITLIVSGFLNAYLYFFAPLIPPNINVESYQEEI